MPEQTSGEPGSLSAGSAVPNPLNAPSGRWRRRRTIDAEAIDVDSPSWRPSRALPGNSHGGGAEAETPKAETPRRRSMGDAPKVEAPPPGKVLICRGDAPVRHRGGASSGMFGQAPARSGWRPWWRWRQGGRGSVAHCDRGLGILLAICNDSGVTARSKPPLRDRCRHRGAEGQRRTCSKPTRPRSADQRSPRQGREAQAEPAAKLAKLSEAWIRFVSRRCSVAAAAARRAKESPARFASCDGTPAAAARRPKWPGCDVGRLVLRDVANGVALIEGRRGCSKCIGDPIPGLAG